MQRSAWGFTGCGNGLALVAADVKTKLGNLFRAQAG